MTDPSKVETINAPLGQVAVIGGDNTGTVNFEDRSHDVVGLANPYLGLRAFAYDDRGKYAGRRQTVEAAVAALTTPGAPRSLLFVTGASGSGKSSFVQAGLLPALEEHYRKRGMTTRWAVFRPSQQPLAMLADALLQLGLWHEGLGTDPQAILSTPTAFAGLVQAATPAGQINLLVVDQFEELFTQSDPAQREALFAILTALPAFAALRTHIVATLRADYLPDLFDRKALYDLAKQGIDLRAMNVAELQETIQRPVQETHPDKRWQAALTERLAKDTAEDAAYLPLLQVTLEEIWNSGRLTLDHYGTLTDAIKQRAEAVYASSLADDRQPRLETERNQILGIFLDLVEVSLDDDAHRDVRHRRRKTELVGTGSERARLIDELVRARLLSSSTEPRGEQAEEMIDVIHETLIRNWDRLEHAVADRRQALQRRVRFEQHVHNWVAAGHDRGRLLQGVGLAEARELARQGDIALRDPEASRLLRQSNSAEQKRRVFILLSVAALLVAMFIAAVYLNIQRGVAVTQRQAAVTAQAQTEAQRQVAVTAQSQADAQRQVAVSRQLAAQSLTHLSDQSDLALLLAVEASRIANTVEARGSVLSGLVYNPQLITFLHSNRDVVHSVAFSPDGKTLASGGGDQTIRLWDVASRQPLGSPLVGHTDVVESVAFSPDGTTLASGSVDKSVRLWDVDASSWLRRVCTIANRNLTPEETHQYLGDAPPVEACPRRQQAG